VTGKISEFDQTNYWMREKLRVPNQLAASAEFPIIARCGFFKIRTIELLKTKKALYDQTIV